MGTRLLSPAISEHPEEAMQFMVGLLEASTEYAIIATNGGDIIEAWNEGARRGFGREPQDVLTLLHFNDLCTNADRDANLAAKMKHEALQSGSWEGMIDLVRADATVFPARVVATRRGNAKHENIGLLIVVKDIAHEIEISQQLETIQLYTRSLIESNIDALITTDAFGIITDINEQMVVLTGVPRDQLIGSRFATYFTDAERAEQGIRTVLREGNLTNYELTARHVSDKQTVVSYNASTYFDREHRLQGVVAAARDVTERIRADEGLRKAQDSANSANRAKSEFLSRMSHELRTPLNAVLGFAALLGEENSALLPRQRTMVEHIERGGHHLLSLIEDVLDISRIEAGHLIVVVESVCLNDVLSEALEMAAPECERCAVITLLDVDPDLYVSADRDRLRQVALNLFSNAAKYNQAGGTITITSARVDSRIRFAVADSGRGIDPRRLDELFTPFSRLGAEKSKIEGTGLGLTVSKAIVGEMDGTLTVESTGPNGTTFVVDLPAAERADVRPRDMRSAGSDNALLRSTARIVYIEDNVDNVELLESVLARHSHVSLLVADDGQSGLALVHEAQPDVVVLDLHLPDMSGRDVLIALKADVATSAIPVVVLTADVLPGNANELRGLGAAAFVTKPFEIKFMLNVLSQQLNKREMVTR